MPQEQKNTHSGANLVEISADHVGQRIDNFLMTRLKGVPRSHIYRLLRSGQVRVNSGRKKPNYRLCEGDNVRIPPHSKPEQRSTKIPDSVIQRLLSSILHEDDELLILNKPSGIPVHSGSGLDFGVIEALRVPYEGQFLELAHRIDRDTSGCLVLAKQRSALTQLNQLFSESGTTSLKKRYTTLLMGDWPVTMETVDVPLIKRRRSGEHMVEVDASGQRAVSHFSRLESFPDATLASVTIETGRTHQIRVHSAHRGHPIAGDEKYGDRVFNRQMRDAGLDRLFLHATSIEFDIGRSIRIEAPLDDELSAFLARLRS